MKNIHFLTKLEVVTLKNCKLLYDYYERLIIHLGNYLMKLFTIFIIFFASQSVQAIDLQNQLQSLKDNGLIPLKKKLGDLKGVLGDLKDSLEGHGKETFTEKKVKKQLASTTFDKKNLENYAEGYTDGGIAKGGYGYKTANLDELKKVAQVLVSKIFEKSEVQKDDFKEHSYTDKKTKKDKIIYLKDLMKEFIQVPDFVGISSDNIKAFLKKHGLDVEVEWEKLITSLGGKDECLKMLKSGKFEQKFLDGIQTLETKVKEVFENAAKNAAAADEVFDFNKEFNESNINETIEKIKKKRNSLIVRSTGKEDTDTLANAGGNESVPNVAPIASDILRAMGVGEPGKTGVVSSYFSQKSFTQRLDGKDPTLFDLPFTPALIQRMIGERVHGLRSDNVKAFLTSNGLNVHTTQSSIKDKIIAASSFNTAFKAEEAAIDEMLAQANTKSWRLRVMSPDGKWEKKNVLATKNALAEAIAFVVNGELSDAGYNLNTAYCAVVIEPELNDKTLERELTRCGVMFTEEPECGISKKDLNAPGWDFSKKARTSGITVIEASYGHNEGVVNSLVGVDKYLVTDVDSIYSIIRPKPFRKFPSLKAGQKLEDRDNPHKLITAPALTTYEVAILKRLAIALEHYYRKPMDVEFVFDRAEGVLYLVQARPIVHSKKSINPSYIEDIAALPYPKYKGSVIGAAGGAVRKIENHVHIIAKATMGEALDAYLKSKNRDAIECVIVGENAPATSHEATQFRTAVKPVIFVPEFSKIETALEQGKNLVIDIQQETVIAWDDSIEGVKKVLKEGWKNYVLPRQLSLIKPEVEKIDDLFMNIDAELTEFVQTEEAKGFDQPTLENFKKTKTESAKQALDLMRSDDEKKARAGLLGLLIFFQKVTGHSLQKGLDQDFVEQVILLKKYFLSIARNVATLLKQKSSSDGYMNRLYFLRLLETLTYQQPSPHEVLHGGSLAQLSLKSAKSEAEALAALGGNFKDLIKAGDEFAKKQVQLARMRDIALVGDVGTKWVNFVANLQNAAITEDDRKKFVSMINLLAKLEILPIWLHTSFVGVYSADCKKTMEKLLAEYNGSEEAFKKISEINALIAQLSPDHFADAKAYKTQYESLKKIVTSVTTQNFKDLFKTTKDLGKAAILSMLEQFVDTFDKSIKATKTQVDVFKSDVKKEEIETLVTRFKEMLQQYFELLKNICDFNANGQTPKSGITDKTLVETKLSKVKEKLNAAYTSDKNQVNSSPNFNVNIPVIGSQADFECPQTLEDIFTFIHQSLINVNSWLMQKVGLDVFAKQNSLILPELVKNILKELYSLEKDLWLAAKIKKISLMGVTFTGNTLSLKFNYPLRSHSSNVMLEYVQGKKPYAKLSCTTAGENEWGRFYKIGDFAKMVGQHCFGVDTEIKQEKKAVTFSWIITPGQYQTIQRKYKKENILGKTLELINDGPGATQEGISYATDGFEKMNKCENKAFNFIKDTLCKDQTQRNDFAKYLLDEALNGSRAMMFIDRSLDLISTDEVWTKAISVMDKLLSGGPYAINSDLAFFRFYRTPAYVTSGNQNLKPNLQEVYYEVNTDNLYQFLNHGGIGNAAWIKDDSAESKQVLGWLGIDSFKNAFARKIFNNIANKFDTFSDPVKIAFAKIMQKHASFFAQLKTISSFASYDASTQLGTLLTNAFFSSVEGLAAKNAIAFFAHQMKTANMGFLLNVTINKDFIDQNLEIILTLPDPVTIFKSSYSATLSQATEEKLLKTLCSSDDLITQKNTFDIIQHYKAALLNPILNDISKQFNYSLLPGMNVGGMAFPHYAIIYKLKTTENIGLVVTLTAEAQLPASWFDATIKNYYAPIVDFGTPTIGQIENVLSEIKKTTDAGKKAVIHCAGGKGRTGTMLACWLVKKWHDEKTEKSTQDAIDLVRTARPGSIETKEQEKVVSDFATYLKTPQITAQTKTNIKNYLNLTEQEIKSAVQEITIKKDLANKDPLILADLQNAFQKGYYVSGNINPNVLELLSLVSNEIITDAATVQAAWNAIHTSLNSTQVPDAIVPERLDQRNKLAEIATAMIKGCGDAATQTSRRNQVLAIFTSGSGRRQKLLAGFILLKADYKQEHFLSNIKAYAQQLVTQGHNFKDLADDCLALT